MTRRCRKRRKSKKLKRVAHRTIISILLVLGRMVIDRLNGYRRTHAADSSFRCVIPLGTGSLHPRCFCRRGPAWLGEKIPNPEKLRPYESGIIPTGTARLRYPVPFFLVAIFFLIFDVEGAYIFSWAVACERIGWTGWMQMSFFIVVLLLGLVYIWQMGGLEWGPKKD
jgi:NADH:ubiquinone oxidoreductase subunit 3 (subunit A)